MDHYQGVAQEILTHLASVLPILREPGFTLKINKIERHVYRSLEKTVDILEVDLGQNESLYVQLSLKSEPAAVSVETSAVEAKNHSEPAGAICVACNSTPVKDERETCTECLIDAGGGT